MNGTDLTGMTKDTHALSTFNSTFKSMIQLWGEYDKGHMNRAGRKTYFFFFPSHIECKMTIV